MSDNFFDQFDAAKPKAEPNFFDQFHEQPKGDEPVMKAREDDGSLVGDNPIMRGISKIGDAARASRNAFTFGLADKAAGLIHSFTRDIPVGQAMKQEQFDSQQARERSPIASAAGDLIGNGALAATGEGLVTKLASKALPWMAKATVPAQMARGSTVTGGMSVADDVAHGEMPDPKKAALAAVIGGVMPAATSPLIRAVDPTSRVRASGLGLSPADIAAAKAVTERAAQQGIQLSVPEAVAAAAPGRAGRVEAVTNNAIKSPEGSAHWADFEASRPAQIAGAADRTAQDISQGSTAPGIPAMEAAKGAIKSAKDLVAASAKPYYQAAEKRIGFSIPKTVEVQRARTQVAKDDTLQEFLGPKTRPNSLKTLDLVKQQMGTNYERAAASGDGLKSKIIAQDKDKLNQGLRKSPDYNTAEEIWGQGQDQLVKPLQAGPLGKIAATNDAGAQHSALFDVATPRARDASIDAAKRMPQPVGQGLLAERLSSMASKDPAGIGSNLLTREGRDVAQHVLPADKMAKLDDLLEVLRAVNPKSVQAGGYAAHGPVDEAWRHIRNIGAGKVTKLMTDPKTLDILGTMGTPEKVANATSALIGLLAARQQFSPSSRAP